MSLFPETGSRSGRSRSRSRDRRPREEDPEAARAVPASFADIREPSYVYPEDDLDDRYKRRRDDPATSGGALPYPEEGDMYSMLPGSQSLYSYDSQKSQSQSQPPHSQSQHSQAQYRTVSPTDESSYRSSREKLKGSSDKPPGAFPEDDHAAVDEGRVRYVQPRAEDVNADKLKYLPQKYASHDTHDDKYSRRDEKDDRYSRRDDKDDRYARRDEHDYRDTRKDDKKHDDEGSNKLKYLPQKYVRKYLGSDNESDTTEDEEGGSGSKKRKDKYDDDLAYGKPPVPIRPKQPQTDLAYGKETRVPSSSVPVSSAAHAMYGSYVASDPRDDPRASKYGRDEDEDRRRPVSPSVDEYGPRSSRKDVTYGDDPRGSRKDVTYSDDPRQSNPNVLTVEPGSRDRERSRDRRKEKSDSLTVESSSRHRDKSRDRSRDRRSRDKSPAPTRSSKDTLTVEGHGHHRSRSKSRDRSSKKEKEKGPVDTYLVEPGVTREKGSSSLMVNTGRMAGMTVATAPASPLLESYFGTYQQSSPMPSPLLLASQDQGGGDVPPLSPLSDDPDGKKRGRRARFHDPEDITTQLANALKGTRTPDTGPLIHILPSLTHDQVMELRVEYKRMVKTGSERKGVNIAKHIRARLKDEDPLLMKACYAVALGRWESEAYWANFWYQGDKTRRELLIEALMGRTNYEIAQIKDAFTDKKYDNSLTKCMKTELKEDKFKKAVLMVLEERRMEETDHYGRRLPLDYALVDQDVDDLRHAIKSEKGGETLMISIVVQRSDSHLRAVLKEYENQFRANFARDALKKSGNLVGELLAHILNGVINRPVRDALLLHHAVSASRKDGIRRELLISRLVRYHWDPAHMQAVKKAFRERYGRDLQDAVREATSGEWGLFCRELCIARTPDDVRQVERVADLRERR